VPRRIVQKIRSQLEDLPKEAVKVALLRVMREEFTELYETIKEKAEAESIVENISNYLKIAKLHEHQRGTIRAIVAASAGVNITNTKLGESLDIDRKTAARGKKRRLEWESDNRELISKILGNRVATMSREERLLDGGEHGTPVYTPLLKKPNINRERIDSPVKNFTKTWMEATFVPSSNTNNLVTKKEKDGSVTSTVKHYRADSYQKLYDDLTTKLEDSHVKQKNFYLYLLLKTTHTFHYS
jgi:RNA-binding protein YhbY